MFLAKKYFSRKERRTYSISVLLKSHWRFSPSNPSLLSYTLVLLPTAQYKEPFSVAPPFSPFAPGVQREKRKKQLLPPLPFSFSSFGRTIRRRRRKSVHFLLSAPARTLFPLKNEGDFFLSLSRRDIVIHWAGKLFIANQPGEGETGMLGRQRNGRRREKLDERGSENVREKKKTSFVIPDEGG